MPSLTSIAWTLEKRIRFLTTGQNGITQEEGKRVLCLTMMIHWSENVSTIRCIP